MAELHLAKDLDTANAAEVARRIVPLQEPADATVYLIRDVSRVHIPDPTQPYPTRPTHEGARS